MKEKAKSFIQTNIKKKRTWIILGVIFIAILYFIFKIPSSATNTVTDIAKTSDLKQTVLATGQVVSNIDLNLSWNGTGVVKSIKVKVGDKVKKGDVLATLEQGAQQAALTSARGALLGAEARKKRVIEGASSEEINLAQVTLDQTKITQNTLVQNAYSNYLNSTLEAVPENGTSDYVAPIISGTYSGDKEGVIKLTSYYSAGGTSFTATGLTTGTGIANTIIAQPIGNSGLYVKFPSNTTINVTDWVINIPNKKAPNYLANYNAYQAAVTSAKSAIDQAQAALALKKSVARSSDIDLANADILSAQGQVEAALARYNDTIIVAPADGTITSIDVKIGELAQAQKEAIVLQDISNIYLETNINEANISFLSVGMPVDITYDSLGPDKIFKGTITKIDPSSTIVSGVVNYKVTASTDQLKDLRPGMTANMTIKVQEKNNVISIPSRAIITNDKGDRVVRIITNKRTKKYKLVPIVTGLEGDGGMSEIISGLNVGDEYVVLIK